MEQKWRYFNTLVQIGYKEIDISFPSASQTEFDFTRKIVETPDAVPADVWLQVLSPCRKELIRRTVDSVTGARKAILSLYIASSDSFQRTIFGLSQQEVLENTIDCVRYARSITKDDPEQESTEWNLVFSPEAFSDTDVEYSVKLCEAVREVWEPTEEIPIILNLPATVEMSTPNTYADQVELFCRSLSRREKVCVSLHPHNDRGCAVAAAELALMAGADRVEGCLFGNGERTGNVDLVTLALNLYTQGIDPRVDFSDLKAVRKTVEECTQIMVHTRAPYGGDLVFLAYSGSHQDAINKAFNKLREEQESRPKWKVPYLPLDPQDVGLTYESVIRVNSQSGKGGVSWTLQRMMELELPRGLQIEFSKVVKSFSERQARTILPQEIADLFFQKYYVLSGDPRIVSASYVVSPNQNQKMSTLMGVDVTLTVGEKTCVLKGNGEDILSSVSNAISGLSSPQLVFASHERHLTLETGNHRVIIVECSNLASQSYWGVSISDDPNTTMLQASLSSALVSHSAPL